ncbi:PREDICTED: putative PRAME family member 26 [Chinchilla lanigera]|uniref:putative PRAME family member 26 n=1 Tax=Chinchilla lanigera TaxID=34839 RepID=UPI000696BEB3|nr:PREDICTED: putative PRAME family member 26 [Chinchilla lanigera]
MADAQKMEEKNSRWKLQALDWRDVNQDFWTVGPRALSAAPFGDGGNKEICNPELSEKNPTLRIFANICFEAWSPLCATDDQLQLCLLKWARRRKASVHLHCEKVMIHSSAVFKILKLLRAVRLDSLHQLEVISHWCPEGMKAFAPQLRKMENLHTFHFRSLSSEEFTSTRENKWYSRICASHLGQLKNLRELQMDEFAPFLGRINNLHKLILSDISGPSIISPEKREQFTIITSQFLKLHCLREIYMNSVHFLEGHLDQWLRCLKVPLETLSLTQCQLSHFDWNQLPHSEWTRQLEHLDLSSSLTTMHLENCGITDVQVCAFLPSLSCCSQLTTFCFVRNFMSMDTMKKLLGHTARLRTLKVELHSIPPEVCVRREGVHLQMWTELSGGGQPEGQHTTVLAAAWLPMYLSPSFWAPKKQGASQSEDRRFLPMAHHELEALLPGA